KTNAMNQWRIKLSLLINYFVFAILLNSVGTVILMVQRNFGISPGSASLLEGFKDFPIAITSFLVASFLVRIGYKRSMLIGLGLVTGICLVMPSIPHFWMTKLLFLTIGVSFALIKVSVFATIGLISNDQKEHLSFMNFLESFFMVGVLSGYFIFSGFIQDNDPADKSWLHVYYLLAGLSSLAFVLLLTTPINESAVNKEIKSSLGEEFLAMIKLMALPLVVVFIVSIFLYVLIEQSIMSWLPTFNKDVLKLPTILSVQMASILAGSQALGRFTAGFVLKKIYWYYVVCVTLVIAAALVLICMPMAKAAVGHEVAGWSTAPVAAFIFPLIGFCLAPVYPAVNSVMLSTLPKHQHGPMSGLIVVFSALGGTIGSIITGHLFEWFGGQKAFYFSLVPITLIMVALYFFNRRTRQLRKT
ncbi:MAG TPA: MFS transporter, partial [Saprospiraceae bacterium]|nr:MFS transporter [Saprospiraceae bacterium]